MNIRRNQLITRAVSFMSASAVAALVSLPALAQSTTRYDVKPDSNAENMPSSPAPSAGTATTDPAYGDPSTDQSNMPMRDSNSGNSSDSSTEAGPSTVGEGVPGPSETPSGSPSVPGASTYDDPNEATETEASETSDPVRQEASNESDRMDGSTQQGPSVVPGETYPGPSETPSGSPSVPGNSNVDDPGNRRLSPVPERDALNDTGDSSDMDDMNQGGDMNQTGPSVVPGETYPGPSETPSGSPSVPGNSEVDDPGMAR